MLNEDRARTIITELRRLADEIEAELPARPTARDRMTGLGWHGVIHGDARPPAALADRTA